MNKISNLLLIAGIIFFSCNNVIFASELPEKWTNCGSDMFCAKNIAGFDFPLNIKKYKVRATDNFIEILIPWRAFSTVELRKTQGSPFANISSCKKDYYIKNEINLPKDEILFTQGDNKKIYVINFWYKDYDYSIYCKKGMTSDDVINIYEMIKSSADKSGLK